MKLFLLFLGLFCFASNSLFARTWTSTDGSRTFEGTLKSYDPETGKAVMIVNGLPLTVRQDKLSEADIVFLKEWAEQAPSESEGASQASVVGEKVSKARVHLLDGKRYRRSEVTKSPDFYVFYYSASW
jgi:hypothetical protein